jgi:hypothetical protein
MATPKFAIFFPLFGHQHLRTPRLEVTLCDFKALLPIVGRVSPRRMRSSSRELNGALTPSRAACFFLIRREFTISGRDRDPSSNPRRGWPLCSLPSHPLFLFSAARQPRSETALRHCRAAENERLPSEVSVFHRLLAPSCLAFFSPCFRNSIRCSAAFDLPHRVHILRE